MTTRAELRSLLAQGRHALSVGRVKEAVALVRAQPRLTTHLVELLFDEDAGASQRAADVLERMTARATAKPDIGGAGAASIERILAREKDAILGLLVESRAKTHLKKLRWNLALIVPRLKLTPAECRRAADVLNTWLDDPSSIVKTLALQGLADLSRLDPSLLAPVVDLLRLYGRSGTPAMRARSRILLKKLERRA
jgi:hypothetical protein